MRFSLLFLICGFTSFTSLKAQAVFEEFSDTIKICSGNNTFTDVIRLSNISTDDSVKVTASDDLTFYDPSNSPTFQPYKNTGKYYIALNLTSLKSTSDTVKITLSSYEGAGAIEVTQDIVLLIKPLTTSGGISINTGANPSCIGSNLILEVASATGPSPLSYQWYRKGSAISGATASTYSDASLSLSDSGSYTVLVSSSCGNSLSSSLNLKVESPTVITSQPLGKTVCAGTDVVLTASATGTGLTYQWHKVSAAVNPALNSSSLTLSSATVANSGDYYLEVTGTSAACGVVPVNTNTVTVLVNPTTTAGALSLSAGTNPACEGSGVTLQVTGSTGSSPLSYQWYRKGSAISGATASTYSDASLSLSDSGSYTVLVSSSCGNSLSSSLNLKVESPTVITSQPLGKTVCAGTDVVLTASATGTGLTYQWHKVSAAVNPALNSSSLILSSATVANSGDYYLEVTGTSAACGVVPVNTNTVTVLVNPSTTAGALSLSAGTNPACEGSGVTLQVTGSTGSSPLSYQWYRKGSAISGATASTYSDASLSLSDSGSYTVLVSSSCGNSLSSSLNLKVESPTVITSQPLGKTVCAGTDVVLTASATGTGLTYQWHKVSAAVNPALNSSSLTLSSATVANSGDYYLEVTGTAAACGVVPVNTNTVTVLVNPTTTAGTLSLSSGNNPACENTSATLSLSGTAGTALTYKWYNKGNLITGSTGSLVLGSVSPTDSGSYHVLVSGTCGNSTSNSINFGTKKLPDLGVISKIYACQGDKVVFNAPSYTGDNLTFRWIKMSNPSTALATSTTHTINNFLTTQNGEYALVATSACGITDTSKFDVEAFAKPTSTFVFNPDKSGNYNISDNLVGVKLSRAVVSIEGPLTYIAADTFTFSPSSIGGNTNLIFNFKEDHGSVICYNTINKPITITSNAVKVTSAINNNKTVFDYCAGDGMETLTGTGTNTAAALFKIDGNPVQIGNVWSFNVDTLKQNLNFTYTVDGTTIPYSISIDTLTSDDIEFQTPIHNAHLCHDLINYEVQVNVTGKVPALGSKFYVDDATVGVSPNATNRFKSAITFNAFDNSNASSKHELKYAFVSNENTRACLIKDSIDFYSEPVPSITGDNIPSTFDRKGDSKKLVITVDDAFNTLVDTFNFKGRLITQIADGDFRFTPSNYAANETVDVIYEYFTEYKCKVDTTFQILVLEAGDIIQNSDPESVYCKDGLVKNNSFVLSVATPANINIADVNYNKGWFEVNSRKVTTYTDLTVLDSIVFNPKDSVVGAYTVKYFYFDTYKTKFESNPISFQLDSVGNVIIDSTSFRKSTYTTNVGQIAYCNSQTSVVIPGKAKSLSGTGSVSLLSGKASLINTTKFVNAAEFYPNLIDTAGVYNFEYTFTRPNSGCFDRDYLTVRVDKIPVVNFSLSTIYSVEDASIDLEPTVVFSSVPETNSSVFSSNDIGITGAGVFSPKTEGVKPVVNITYTHTDGRGCTNTRTKTTEIGEQLGKIDITSNPSSTNSIQSAFCNYDGEITFSGTAVNWDAAEKANFSIQLDDFTPVNGITLKVNTDTLSKGNHKITFNYYDVSNQNFSPSKTIFIDSITRSTFVNDKKVPYENGQGFCKTQGSEVKVVPTNIGAASSSFQLYRNVTPIDISAYSDKDAATLPLEVIGSSTNKYYLIYEHMSTYDCKQKDTLQLYIHSVPQVVSIDIPRTYSTKGKRDTLEVVVNNVPNVSNGVYAFTGTKINKLGTGIYEMNPGNYGGGGDLEICYNYSYKYPSNQSCRVDTCIEVTILESEALIKNSHASSYFCNDGLNKTDVFSLSVDLASNQNTVDAGFNKGWFKINNSNKTTGHGVLKDSVLVDPKLQKVGTYTVTYFYYDTVKTLFESDPYVFMVDSVGVVVFDKTNLRKSPYAPDLNSFAYCSDADEVKISGKTKPISGEGKVKLLEGKVDLLDTLSYLNASGFRPKNIDTAGVYNFEYTFTRPLSNCFGKDYLAVRVDTVPEIDFILSTTYDSTIALVDLNGILISGFGESTKSATFTGLLAKISQDGVWSPKNVTERNPFDITYSHEDGRGCKNTITKQTVVSSSLGQIGYLHNNSTSNNPEETFCNYDDSVTFYGSATNWDRTKEYSIVFDGDSIKDSVLTVKPTELKKGIHLVKFVYFDEDDQSFTLSKSVVLDSLTSVSFVNEGSVPYKNGNRFCANSGRELQVFPTSAGEVISSFSLWSTTSKITKGIISNNAKATLALDQVGAHLDSLKLKYEYRSANNCFRNDSVFIYLDSVPEILSSNIPKTFDLKGSKLDLNVVVSDDFEYKKDKFGYSFNKLITVNDTTYQIDPKVYSNGDLVTVNYTYTTKHNCVVSKAFPVKILSAQTQIVNADPNYNSAKPYYCLDGYADTNSFYLFTEKPTNKDSNSLGWFTMNNNLVTPILRDAGKDSILLAPKDLRKGRYEVSYYYYDTVGTLFQSDLFVFNIDSVGYIAFDVSGLRESPYLLDQKSFAYCNSSTSVKLEGIDEINVVGSADISLVSGQNPNWLNNSLKDAALFYPDSSTFDSSRFVFEYKYTLKNSGCVGLDTVEIMVTKIPELEFNLASQFSSSQFSIPLSQKVKINNKSYTDWHSKYSDTIKDVFTGSLAKVGDNGEFNPSIVTKGISIPITYSFTDFRGCSNNITKSTIVKDPSELGVIQVLSGLSSSLYTDSVFCNYDKVAQLKGSADNRDVTKDHSISLIRFKSNGLVDTVLIDNATDQLSVNPQTLKAAKYAVRYVYQDENKNQFEVVKKIEIEELKTVAFVDKEGTPFKSGNSICADKAFSLYPTTLGSDSSYFFLQRSGDKLNTGIINTDYTQLDLNLSQIGYDQDSLFVHYGFVSDNECSRFDSISVFIGDVPTIDSILIPATYDRKGDVDTLEILVSIDTVDRQGTYSFSGPKISQLNNGQYAINPAEYSNKTPVEIRYQYVSEFGCKVSSTINVFVQNSLATIQTSNTEHLKYNGFVCKDGVVRTDSILLQVAAPSNKKPNENGWFEHWQNNGDTIVLNSLVSNNSDLVHFSPIDSIVGQYNFVYYYKDSNNTVYESEQHTIYVDSVGLVQFDSSNLRVSPYIGDTGMVAICSNDELKVLRLSGKTKDISGEGKVSMLKGNNTLLSTAGLLNSAEFRYKQSPKDNFIFQYQFSTTRGCISRDTILLKVDTIPSVPSLNILKGYNVLDSAIVILKEADLGEYISYDIKGSGIIGSEMTYQGINDTSYYVFDPSKAELKGNVLSLTFEDKFGCKNSKTTTVYVDGTVGRIYSTAKPTRGAQISNSPFCYYAEDEYDTIIASSVNMKELVKFKFVSNQAKFNYLNGKSIDTAIVFKSHDLFANDSLSEGYHLVEYTYKDSVGAVFTIVDSIFVELVDSLEIIRENEGLGRLASGILSYCKDTPKNLDIALSGSKPNLAYTLQADYYISNNNLKSFSYFLTDTSNNLITNTQAFQTGLGTKRILTPYLFNDQSDINVNFVVETHYGCKSNTTLKLHFDSLNTTNLNLEKGYNFVDPKVELTNLSSTSGQAGEWRYSGNGVFYDQETKEISFVPSTPPIDVKRAITFAYTDSVTTCTTWDTVWTHVGELKMLYNIKDYYCSDYDEEYTLEINKGIGKNANFDLSKDFRLTLDSIHDVSNLIQSSDENKVRFVFNPGVNMERKDGSLVFLKKDTIHNFTFEYQDKYGAKYSVTKEFKIDSIEALSFGVEDYKFTEAKKFCSDELELDLSPVPFGGKFYINETNELSEYKISNEYWKDTIDITKKDYTFSLTYWYEDKDSKCRKSVDTTITIVRKPVDIKFALESDSLCASNDALINNITPAYDTVSVTNWIWDFNGVEEFDSKVSSIEHLFIDTSNTITLTGIIREELNGETVDICSYTFEPGRFSFGLDPSAKFGWKTGCIDKELGGIVIFSDESEDSEDYFSKISSYKWSFVPTSQSNTCGVYTEEGALLNKNFDGADEYLVCLAIETSFGCVDTAVAKVAVTTYEKGNYFSDFDLTNGGWFVPDEPSSVFVKDDGIWELGIDSLISTQSRVWVTALKDNYADDTLISVVSPCFDFTTLQRPMVSFDRWMKMQDGNDAVVLQYTTDEFVTNVLDANWHTVGVNENTLTPGVEWYNDQGIAVLKEAADGAYGSYGWNGFAYSNTLDQLNNVRHDLDVLVGESYVRFRFLLASDKTNNDLGFAFDNFEIKDRSRNVLFEHFTNNDHEAEINELSNFNEINKKDVILLDYDKPDTDTKDDFYEVYGGSDLSSASAVNNWKGKTGYNITSLPRLVENGSVGTTFGTLDDEVTFRSEMLADPQWNFTNIEFEGIPGEPSLFRIRVEFTPNKELFNLKDTAFVKLKMAIVEDVESPDGLKRNSVVRSLLPSPAGIALGRGVSSTSSGVYIYQDTIRFVNYIENQKNVSLVASLFSQKNDKFYVYQAAKVAIDPEFVVGLEYYQDIDNKFTVYPNPTRDRVFVSFEKSLNDELDIQVVSMYGNIILDKISTIGAQQVELNLEELPVGVYVIQILKEGELIATGRVSKE